MSINIVVFITPAESFVAELTDLFLDLRVNTLKEAGCFEFSVYKHEKDFVLIEEWKDQEAIDLHMQEPYTDTFKQKIAGKILNTSVKRLVNI